MTPLLTWISATCQLSNQNDTTISKKIFFWNKKTMLKLLWSVLAYFPFLRDQGSQQEPEARKICQLFHMNSLPTFLWKLRPKRPKFNDICVLFKYSNFCSRILQNFMPPDPPNNLRFERLHVAPVVWGFSFSTCPKAFATYLKPYWKPWKIHRIMLELTHYLTEYVIDISP